MSIKKLFIANRGEIAVRAARACEKRKIKAVVMTPIEINKDYENTLKLSLKKVTDRDIDIEYVMDPSLLGGILIKMGSTMYDTSLKGQLRLLKDELIKG